MFRCRTVTVRAAPSLPPSLSPPTLPPALPLTGASHRGPSVLRYPRGSAPAGRSLQPAEGDGPADQTVCSPAGGGQPRGVHQRHGEPTRRLGDLSVTLSLCLFGWLVVSVGLTFPYVFLLFCLSFSLSLCLSVFLSVCLCLYCLSVWLAGPLSILVYVAHLL